MTNVFYASHSEIRMVAMPYDSNFCVDSKNLRKQKICKLLSQYLSEDPRQGGGVLSRISASWSKPKRGGGGFSRNLLLSTKLHLKVKESLFL